MRIPPRFHRYGYGGYSIPGPAVAGASDTGTWSDSPCPTPAVKAEIRQLQTFLRKDGIRTRQYIGRSCNLFCAKRWLCVRDTADFTRATALTRDYLRDRERATHYLHDAT